MSPRERILTPYTRRVDDMAHRLRKLFWSVMLVTLAILMGFTIAILPVNFLIIPMMPLIILVLVALWMAPDIDPALDRPFRILFLCFIAAQLVWPHYTAFRAPGIGYITPPRLFMLGLAGVGLWMLATSARIRAVLGGALSLTPLTKWAFIVFMTYQILMAVVTLEVRSAWLNSLVFWYLVFLFAVVAFSYEGMANRMWIIILCSIPILTSFAYWEYTHLAKTWMYYTPAWLQGDPAVWNKVIEGMSRAGTDRYRASGLLMNSVTLGEFIALVIPFVLHLAFSRFSGRARWLAVPLVLFAAAGIEACGARTAFAGGLVGVGVYAGLVVARRYLHKPQPGDLVAPAGVSAFPIAGVLAAAAVLFVPRINRAVLGGAEHAASDAGRERQWAATWEKLLEAPWGHGPFQSGRAIGLVSRDGSITIDGFYMNLLLDFGVIGTAAYALFLIGAVGMAARAFMRASSKDEELCGAVAASLMAFVVTRGVLSLHENHAMMFSLAGLAVGVYWRQEMRLKAARPAALPAVRGRAAAEAAPGARPALAMTRPRLSRAS